MLLCSKVITKFAADSAENGCFIRPRPNGRLNTGEWLNMVSNLDMSWKSACLEMLHYVCTFFQIDYWLIDEPFSSPSGRLAHSLKNGRLLSYGATGLVRQATVREGIGQGDKLLKLKITSLTGNTARDWFMTVLAHIVLVVLANASDCVSSRGGTVSLSSLTTSPGPPLWVLFSIPVDLHALPCRVLVALGTRPILTMSPTYERGLISSPSSVRMRSY